MKIPQTSEQYRVIELSRQRGLYRLIVKAGGVEYIAQTGGAVTTYIDLPDESRIRKIGWVHTTSTPTTLSADLLTYTLDAKIFGSAVAGVRIDAYTGTASSYLVEMGESYEEPVERLTFSTNTTNTDCLHVFIDIQCVGDGK